MKKLLLFFMAMVMLAFLVACDMGFNKKDKDEDDDDSSKSSKTSITSSTLDSSVGGTTDSSDTVGSSATSGSDATSGSETIPSSSGAASSAPSADDTGSSGTVDSSDTELVIVAFRLNGGTVVSGETSVNVEKGGKLTAVPECARDGYVFVCWSYTVNGLSPWSADDVFTTDTALYAIWTVETADSSGDTTDSSEAVNDSNEGTTDSREPTTDSTAPDTKVTITFNPTGGTIKGEATVKIEAGAKLSYANVPTVTKYGYILKGWSYDPYGTEMWSARNDVFNEDWVLFAVWERDPDVTIDTEESTTDTTEGEGKPDVEESLMVSIIFDANGGTIAADYVEILYGSKLTYSKVPTPTREGYTLKGWAYDPYGNEMWSARNDVFTDDETELFAIWERVDTTDTSNPPSTDSSSAGGSDGKEEGVRIEFDTGLGYFVNVGDYEQIISVGGRIPTFPTPVHDNEAMVFEGWYTDPELTIPASRSTKHYTDTVLYAKWYERVQCTDGSYDHVWGSWDVDTKATCTKSGTDSRYCAYCGNKDVKAGDAPLGHNWNGWEEAFMRKERSCARLGCTDKEIVEYEDVTVAVLGNTPGKQVSGNTEAFYMVPFTNMINGKWDDGYGEVVSLRGNGSAYVQFDFVAPETIDRVYFKGKGVTAVNVFVKYEGNEDFTLIGVCSSSPDKESTPFVAVNGDKKVVAVKFVEDCPPQGQSMWQEVAFVKVVD